MSKIGKSKRWSKPDKFKLALSLAKLSPSLFEIMIVTKRPFQTDSQWPTEYQLGDLCPWILVYDKTWINFKTSSRKVHAADYNILWLYMIALQDNKAPGNDVTQSKLFCVLHPS